MPRLSPDQWAAVRIEWEGDPLATFGSLAGKYNIDKAQLSRRARQEGWSKRNQIGSINEAAARRADAQTNPDGSKTQRKLNTTQRKLNAVDLATREESEAKRAAVLVRHRQEWAELEQFRQAALAAMKAAHEGSREWREAKTAAETIAANARALDIKQQGEARAWMLDMKQEEEIVIKNPRSMS
ncbi:MAG: hypothetical protein ACUVR3_10745 [Candidatus Roseilinea sp.]|uniref:hypothetical protein n=1 Tax=Candidatus Roseilinea sp. TaxID=2838777 RepID=UPI00404935C3